MEIIITESIFVWILGLVGALVIAQVILVLAVLIKSYKILQWLDRKTIEADEFLEAIHDLISEIGQYVRDLKNRFSNLTNIILGMLSLYKIFKGRNRQSKNKRR